MYSEIVGIHYFSNVYQLFQIVKFHHEYGIDLRQYHKLFDVFNMERCKRTKVSFLLNIKSIKRFFVALNYIKKKVTLQTSQLLYISVFPLSVWISKNERKVAQNLLVLVRSNT